MSDLSAEAHNTAFMLEADWNTLPQSEDDVIVLMPRNAQDLTTYQEQFALRGNMSHTGSQTVLALPPPTNSNANNDNSNTSMAVAIPQDMSMVRAASG